MEEQTELLAKIQGRFPRAAEGIQLAKCHHCATTKIVIGCFPNEGCDIRYCEHCLKGQYHEDVVTKLETLTAWVCPFKQGKCTCTACAVKHLRVYYAERSDDLIQSALDYNSQLLLQLNHNRALMTKQDAELCMKVLYENLKHLSKLADLHKKEERGQV